MPWVATLQLGLDLWEPKPYQAAILDTNLHGVLPKQGTNHMLGLRSIAAKIFGTTNDRKVVKYRGPVEEMNQLETEFEGLSDAELKAKTASFKADLASRQDP